jgi:hypothetical protein
LPSIPEIFQICAGFYEKPLGEFFKAFIGQKNLPHQTAISLSIHYSQAPLRKVAEYLGDVAYSAIAKS